MALNHLPVLPNPASWFPGHMMKFTRMLPVLLKRTNVVLEIRDSRLPLTSINRTLEDEQAGEFEDFIYHLGCALWPRCKRFAASNFIPSFDYQLDWSLITGTGALRKWRLERGWAPNDPTRRIMAVEACEHIVVLNKRDLVPEWGVEPFRRAMAQKFPYQRTLFASWRRPRDIRNLSEILVNIAKEYPHAMELNVLVIGMPNVGKSTLLNALRNMGIKGPTPKAFQTSANPGMTRALSTRLKLCLDPLVYAYDTPGVMLPFLGRGTEGAERGVKLALIAGIKEGLYDMEALAAYLLYRLNVLNPSAPAYLHLLPPGSPSMSDLEEFLTLLGQRMGMLKRGGEVDTARAAVYFVRWWREEGGLLSASSAPDMREQFTSGTALPANQAWGFDFQWDVRPQDTEGGKDPQLVVQGKMEQCIEEYLVTTDREDAEENNVSPTQLKKKLVMEEKLKRKLKHAKRK